MNASSFRRTLLQAGLLAMVAATGFALTRHVVLPQVGAATASAPATLVATSARADAPRPAPSPRLVASFRLDPTLTQGLQMGDRWVSPPEFYFAQPGTQFVVQVKAQNLDARGAHLDVAGDWATTNPEMVAITRGPDGITLVVREPGESDLTLRAGAGIKSLHISAERLPDSMRVRITQ